MKLMGMKFHTQNLVVQLILRVVTAKETINNSNTLSRIVYC